jgi:hypothetical protein
VQEGEEAFESQEVRSVKDQSVQGTSELKRLGGGGALTEQGLTSEPAALKTHPLSLVAQRLVARSPSLSVLLCLCVL